MGSERLLVIYDGDCSFCKEWVGYWKHLTADRVDYEPYQTALRHHQEISVEDCKKAVQFVTPEGRTRGAEAVAELYARGAGQTWFRSLYKLPPVAWFTEAVYSLIAAHRSAGYKVTHLLWGSNPQPSTWRTAVTLYLRLLAIVYAIAFASFGMQVRGLIGSDGILPLAQYLEIARGQLGNSAYWRLPTIFWWAPGDYALLSIAWGGFTLSLVAAIARPHSRWQRGAFIVLVLYYLSLVSAGQVFMGFQWDALLIEAGFLGIFLRATRLRVFLSHWLLFRLMFESGLVKLLSGDKTWRSLTALTYHYQTQPLPTIVAWYAAKLPLWFQQTSTVIMFAIELLAPFLIFGPRRLKHIAAFSILGLQFLIALTGSYTFFNLLTAALCLLLFDDVALGLKQRGTKLAQVRPRVWVSWALTTSILLVSGLQLIGLFRPLPGAGTAVLETVAPFQLVNQYGLFAVMTTTRPEIQVEGSDDGQNWQPYVFPYKPGPLDRAPVWVAPLQPRLDWQMWFAALGSYRENPWFVRFVLKMLEGSKPVQDLLAYDPFGRRPPLYIRAQVYEYRFTSFEEHKRTGNWWARELKGAYIPPVSLRANP